MMETIKRSEGKLNADYRIAHMKQFYNGEHKEVYGKVISDVNEAFMQLCITDNVPIQLPNMGYIQVFKFKVENFDKDGNPKNRMNVDYGAMRKHYNETGKWIQILHDDEYVCTFRWNKHYSNLRGKHMYKFKAARANERYLAKCWKDPEMKIDFFESKVPTLK